MNEIGHILSHWDDVLIGATAIGIVAHAVNTFPTPQSKYGSWLLGLIQYIVGQRVAAINTMKGKDSVITGISKGDGNSTNSNSNSTPSNPISGTGTGG